MKNGLEKLLRKTLLEKYPIFLDVHVVPRMEGVSNHLVRTNNYDVLLVIFEKDWEKMENSYAWEIDDYIKSIAKYMDIKIIGVHNEIVDEDEWEDMKIKKD